MDRNTLPSVAFCFGCRYSLIGSYSVSCTNVHDMLEQHSTRFELIEEHSQIHQELKQVIAQQLKKSLSKVEALKKAIEGGSEADATQKKADLITANLYRCERSVSLFGVLQTAVRKVPLHNIHGLCGGETGSLLGAYTNWVLKSCFDWTGCSAFSSCMQVCR